MHLVKLLEGEPLLNLFSRDEPRLRGVEFIEDVEQIALVSQSSPVAEVFVERQKSDWKLIERVNRHVEEAGKHGSNDPDGPARQFVDTCAFHPF